MQSQRSSGSAGSSEKVVKEEEVPEYLPEESSAFLDGEIVPLDSESEDMAVVKEEEPEVSGK